MKPEELYGLVPISRKVMSRPIYKAPAHWRLLYFHIRLMVNYADNQPVVGLKRNQGHFDYQAIKQYLAGMPRSTYQRAITWMKGTPELDPSDPQYMAPIILAERTTRGLRITWCEPEAELDFATLLATEGKPDPAPQQLTLVPETSTQKKGRPTWLTPFGDAWEKHCGGEIAWGQAGISLKPLVKQHGEEKVMEYWLNYLQRNRPDMCSPARFKATFKTWSSPTTSAPVPGRKESVSQADYTNPLNYEGRTS